MRYAVRGQEAQGVCVDDMQAPLGYFDPLGLSKDSRQHESLRVKRFTELCLGVLFSTFL